MSFPEGTPTVTIDLGGPRALGFTLGAMRRIKETHGSLKFDQEDETAMVEAIPAYVWSCMEAADRADLSVEDIEDMIHPRNMKAISDAIAELFLASQPEGAEGNALPVPPKVRKAAARK